MEFTPWTLFVDLGLASLLLLVGQVLRARVRLVQKLFLPANVIGGGLGLALGASGLGWVPFSAAISSYPGILIALIFVTLPFSAARAPRQAIGKNVAELFAYSTTTILLQWGLGLAFALGLLRLIWSDLHPGFGAILASGFVGGHGTAAAIGAAFAPLGWEEAGPLAMTSATVGILASIIGGMVWIKWGTRKEATRFVAPFDKLPDSLRTGLLPDAERRPSGQETVSSNTIDPLALHLALVAAIALVGYWVAEESSRLLDPYHLPTFCGAFLAAVVLKRFFRWVGAYRYIDAKTMVRIGGTCTDFLVIFGIASINIAILIEYAYPLFTLLTFGIVVNGLLFRFWGPRAFSQFWFEKSLYTWGWVNGVMAMAIALLRSVDPEGESHLLDDFALAYLGFGPVEVIMVTLTPMLIAQGFAWPLAVAAIGAAGLVFFLLHYYQRRGQSHQ
jgi:ESS family glutamate:Na+ symporter